jgi:hypothetical protein
VSVLRLVHHFLTLRVHCLTTFYRKLHKPTCKAAQADSPSTSNDPISKLTGRINAARFQQSRTRQFSTFITPQNVISAAEKSYKDAMRDAETLLRCEPEYRDEFVGDETWIDERWEWVDLCEKILVSIAFYHMKWDLRGFLITNNSV